MKSLYLAMGILFLTSCKYGNRNKDGGEICDKTSMECNSGKCDCFDCEDCNGDIDSVLVTYCPGNFDSGRAIKCERIANIQTMHPQNVYHEFLSPQYIDTFGAPVNSCVW